MIKKLLCQYKIIIASVLAIGLIACGGGSSSSGGGLPNSGDVSIGVLPNGSTVYSSSANYTVAANSSVTGTIGLTDGSVGYVGVVTFSVKASRQNSTATILPTITTSALPCVLNSALSLAQTCQITISGNGATNGTYIATPTITSDGVPQQLNNLLITVDGNGGNVVSGNLAVLASASIKVGETKTATIVLDGSSNVSNLEVKVSSSNQNIMTVNTTNTNNTCTLSTSANSCKVTVTGVAEGKASILATSVSGSASKLITVSNSINLGHIHLKLIPSTIVVGHQNAKAEVTLTGAVGVNSVVVDISSSDPKVANLSANSCTITAPSTSCDVTVIGEKGGAALITAIRSDNLQKSSATLEVTGLYAYVTNQTTGSISIYGFNANGNLTKQGGDFATGLNNPGMIIGDPSGQYIYAVDSNNNRIAMYMVGNDGKITPLSTPTVAAGISPMGIAIAPSGKYAYVVVGYPSGKVLEYALNSSTGILTPLATPSIPSGSMPNRIAIDPSGRYAYVTNNADGTVSMYSINSTTGTLSALGAAIQAGNQPYGIVVDPSGKYAYVTNSGDGTVSMYSINSATGVLSALGAAIPAGASPQAIAVDPTGKYVYVANNGVGSVSMYGINSTNGLLTPLAPATIPTKDFPKSIAVDPSGKYVYTTNSGFDTVSMYQIGNTGNLSPLNPLTVATGQVPFGFTFN